MKDIKQIHQKLDEQCPSDYRINEIIYFAYPYRRLRIAATVNKMPEESIRQIYSVLLRSIAVGYRKEEEIRAFLGLQRDDFLLRELYFLRERGYLNLISSEWHITEYGNAFIKDNSVLKILENEEFEFLIDAINEEVLPKENKLFMQNSFALIRNSGCFVVKYFYQSKDRS